MAEGGIAKAPRYLVSEDAVIEFDDRRIDCLVRNLSETGAAIEVPNQPGIPMRFELTTATWFEPFLPRGMAQGSPDRRKPLFRPRPATTQPCSLHAS